MAIIGAEKVKDPQRRKRKCRGQVTVYISNSLQARLCRQAFYLATFFQYNKRLLRQKTGGACLYMPQDGHWLASFEVIPPPKKS